MNIQESFTREGAALYVCSTPIGNLDDVSFRLLEVLRTADVVAAEDTRHTRKLLSRYDIHPPQLVSYHQHNRNARVKDLESWWEEGKRVALVSDAGTPGVSDPGEEAITLAILHNVPVIPVPGPSAVLSALVGSGFALQPFTFVGFLPKEGRQIQAVLEPLQKLPGVLIFYEAPHRLHRTLKLLEEHFGNREVVLAKELTKRHESFIRGNWQEILAYIQDHDPRGEFVVVLGPPLLTAADEGLATQEMALRWQQAIQQVREDMESGFSHTDAVRKVASETGFRRKELYKATLNMED